MKRGASHFTTLCVVALVLGYLVVYVELFIPKGASNWDTCSVDRFATDLMIPAATTPQKFSKTLMFLTEILVFATCAQLVIWKFVSAEGVKVRERTFSGFLNYSAAFDFCYVALWFVATYMLVVFLKDSIGDTTCNNKPNSVSGHTCYFVFYALTLYYLGIYRAPPDYSLRRHLWNASFILVVILAYINLRNTYYGGYHSIRQMVYGGFVGLVSHLACVSQLLNEARSTHGKRKHIMLWFLMYVGFVSFVWLSHYFATIHLSLIFAGLVGLVYFQ